MGAHDGRIVEVAGHRRELRAVTFEQGERGMNVGPELVLLNFHLEYLRGVDKTTVVECRPMVMPQEHIQEGTVALITAFEGNERVRAICGAPETISWS
jgi:hypothetical protein